MHYPNFVATTPMSIAEKQSIAKQLRILDSLVEDPRNFLEADLELRKNPEFVALAMRHNLDILEYVEPAIRSNRQIFLVAALYDGNYVTFGDDSITSDRTIMHAAVHSEPLAYRFATGAAKTTGLTKAAVSNHGRALGYAPKEMCDNMYILDIALNNDGLALEFATPRIRAWKEKVLLAVNKNGTALEFAASNLQDDPEVVAAAIRNDITAGKYASERIKNMFSFNLAIKTKDYKIFEGCWQSEGILEEKDIALAAIRINARSYRYMPDHQGDKIIAKIAIARWRDAYQFVPEDIASDPELTDSIENESSTPEESLLENCIEHLDDLRNGEIMYASLSESCQCDEKHALAAVSYDPDVYQYLFAEVRTKDVIIATLKGGNNIFGNLRPEYQRDKDVIAAMRSAFPSVVYDSSFAPPNRDRESIIAALTEWPDQILNAPEEIKNDREYITVALTAKPALLGAFPDAVRGDREMVLSAVSKDGMALMYASLELSDDREIVGAAVAQNPRDRKSVV